MLDRRTLAACCVLAVPAACFAQSYTADQYFDSRWYITPFGTYVNADNDRHADDGWGGGVAVGKPISPNWNIELRTQYEELDANNVNFGKYKNWSGSIDAQWFFLGRTGFRMWQSGSVQPYLVGGIGAISDRFSGPRGDDSKTSFMANLGAGIVWPIAPWGRLVFDARYRYDANNNRVLNSSPSHLNEALFTVGLQIPLGPAPTVATPPPPAPAAMAPAPVAATRNISVSADGTFAFDKAVLTPDGQTRLDTALRDLSSKGFRAHSVAIIGYTDPLGSAAYNQRLSLARANAVRDQMVSKGVPANVITTEGRGEADLKVTEADCKSQGKAKSHSALIDCLAPNRRVEIHATGEQPQ